MPVLRALATDDSLKGLLGRPIEGDELVTALAAVRSDGAVKGTLATAHAFAADAIRALESLEPGDGTTWLRGAVDQLFARVESVDSST